MADKPNGGKREALTWEDFWPIFMTVSPEQQKDLARQINLEAWLKTKSHKIVAEVLSGAPKPVIKYFWEKIERPAKAELLKSWGYQVKEMVNGRRVPNPYNLPQEKEVK